MPPTLNELAAGRWTENDPGRSIRCWVAGFLRIGLGLSLLSAGLAEYFGQRGSVLGGNAFGAGAFVSGFDPLFSAVPYLAIGLGLALILGFLTTAAAIGSAFFSLLAPLVMIAWAVSVGGAQMPNRGMGGVISMMMGSNSLSLIPYAAMIWLSPLEYHPISIDALIFGRQEFRPTLARPTPQEAEVKVEPSTEERVV